MEKKYNYTYKVELPETGEFYLGVHKSDIHPSIDNYKGSMLSWKVDKSLLTKIQPIEFFDTYECACHAEAELIKTNIANPLNRNGHIPGVGFSTHNLAIVKDSNDNIFSVAIDDHRYLNGELVGVMKGTKNDNPIKGMVTVKDNDGNTFQVSKDDPRYLSGELVGVMKGMVTVKDKDNNTMSVSINDPRYLSGELVGATLGNTMSTQTRKNMSISAKAFGERKWLKNKINVKDSNDNIFHISNDDPRYLSGELVSVNKNKVPVKDSDGNTFSVAIDDPRYISGELQHVKSGIITAKDKNGKVFSITKDDPRYLNGELVGVMKGINVGKIHIKNEKMKKSKMINKSDFALWESKGWVKGRLKRIKI